MAHTPGPWAFDAVRGLIYHRPDPLTQYVIADMESSNDGNGHLIAAAPALLEALKGIVPTNLGKLPETAPDSCTLPLDVTFGEMRAVLAAIAQAQGQTHAE